jgi:hypothetical protein
MREEHNNERLDLVLPHPPALVALWLLVAAVAGLPVWLDLPVAAAMMTYFVWLPRSCRYVVREDQPLAPFGRDERSQALSSRAGPGLSQWKHCWCVRAQSGVWCLSSRCLPLSWVWCWPLA